MSIGKTVNLALSFLLELYLLAAVGYWGFKTGTGLLPHILFGIGLPIGIIVLWGIFLAPASTRKLPGVIGLILKLILFALASSALYSTGQTTLAIILAGVFLVNSALAILWGQEKLSQ